MSRVFGRLGPLVLVLFGLVGCESSGGPAVQYVEGVVTLDGSPIEGVTVSFSPAKAGSGTPAVGTTDTNGVFKLTATQGGSVGGGAGIGDYQVTFTKVKASGGLRTDMKPGDPDYGKEDTSSKPGPSTVEYVVPQKYGNPATSGFTATVVKGTNKGDKFKFDLTSK